MNIRKIAVVGSFAAGAALALAPLASADPAATDPLTSVVASEDSLLNSLFVSDATLAGVPSTDYAPVGGLDTILLADVAKDAPLSGTPSILDYELYGLSPFVAGVSSDSGSFSVLNGALTEWTDAYNIELYSLLNPTLAADTIPAADLIGSTETIQDAFANGTGSVSDVATYFYEFGANDLAGYLDLPAFFPSLIP
jgi:hypothetical protein